MEVEEHVKISAKRSNSFSGVEDKRLGGDKSRGRARRNSADMNLSTCQHGVGQKTTPFLFGAPSRVLFSSFPSKVLRKGVKRKRESVKMFPRSTKKQQLGRSYVFSFPLMSSSTYNQPRGESFYRQTAELSCAVVGNKKDGLSFPSAPAPLQVNISR